MNEILIGFITGLIVGIVANFITEYLKNWQEHKKYEKFYGELSGYWLETIERQSERKYSIGYLHYDKKTKKPHYNGINFKNNGIIYYYWRTEKVWIDQDKDKMLYIYSVSEDNRLFELKEGFGVNLIKKSSKGAEFTKGYFVDSEKVTTPRHLKLKRLSELADKMHFKFSNYSENEFSEFIIRLNNDKY